MAYLTIHTQFNSYVATAFKGAVKTMYTHSYLLGSGIIELLLQIRAQTNNKFQHSILYAYKFLRHVNFEDATNLAFLQFYF